MQKRQWLRVLGLSIGLGGSLPAFAKDVSELHQAALQAFNEARYEDALRLFKQAYEVTHTPEVLVRIGQTQLKLGRKAEALDACLNYLSLTADRPEPIYRGVAEQCVAEARKDLVPKTPIGAGTQRPQQASPAQPPSKAPPYPIEEDDPPGPKQPGTAPRATTISSQRVASPPAPQVVASPPAPSVVASPPAPPVVAAPPAPPVPAALAASMAAVPAGASLSMVYDYCLQKQREGMGDAAQRCYDELVPNALRSSGMQENDIALVTSQLRRYPNPAVAVPWLSQQRIVEKRNTGLWAAGLTLWLSALVPAVVMGPLYAENPVYGERADLETVQKIHYTLMIPVVGPFISGIWLPLVSSDRTYVGIHYTVPWVVADGLAQLAGITMLIAGAQTTRYRLPPGASQIVRSLQIVPLRTPETTGLALSGRF